MVQTLSENPPPSLTYALELLNRYSLDVPDVNRQMPEDVGVPGDEDHPCCEAPEGPVDGGAGGCSYGAGGIEVV